MLEARAIYNNKSDVRDELSFKKGDILEVIERDFHGLNGWWLCRINGTLGIAPGNRLSLMSPLRKATSLEKNLEFDGNEITSPKKNLNVPKWHRDDKVVVPRFTGNNYEYEDVQNSIYDVPPFRHTTPSISVDCCNTDSLEKLNTTNCLDKNILNYERCLNNCTEDLLRIEQTYNVPSKLFQASPDVVSSNRSSGLSILSSSSRLSNHSSRSNEHLLDLYDIPSSVINKSPIPQSILKVQSISAERDSLLEDYSVPKCNADSKNERFDSDDFLRENNCLDNVGESLYDFPNNEGDLDINEQELYNTPKQISVNTRLSSDLNDQFLSTRKAATALNNLYFNNYETNEGDSSPTSFNNDNLSAKKKKVPTATLR